MEHVKLKSLSGIAKLAGVALCLAGILVIALYAGPSVSPVNHHRAFASHASSAAHVVTRSAWVKWTFLVVLANTEMDIPHGPRQHGVVSLDRPPGQYVVVVIATSFFLQCTLWTYGFLQHAVELAIFGLISRASPTLFQLNQINFKARNTVNDS